MPLRFNLADLVEGAALGSADCDAASVCFNWTVSSIFSSEIGPLGEKLEPLKVIGFGNFPCSIWLLCFNLMCAKFGAKSHSRVAGRRMMASACCRGFSQCFTTCLAQDPRLPHWSIKLSILSESPLVSQRCLKIYGRGFLMMFITDLASHLFALTHWSILADICHDLSESSESLWAGLLIDDVVEALKLVIISVIITWPK